MDSLIERQSYYYYYNYQNLYQVLLWRLSQAVRTTHIVRAVPVHPVSVSFHHRRRCSLVNHCVVYLLHRQRSTNKNLPQDTRCLPTLLDALTPTYQVSNNNNEEWIQKLLAGSKLGLAWRVSSSRFLSSPSFPSFFLHFPLPSLFLFPSPAPSPFPSLLCSRSITLAARSAENRIQSVCLDLQVSASGGTDVSHWTVLTGVWISQSWSPPFCRAGQPCSTTLQDNKIWPEKFCCCRCNFVELTPIVSSRPITNTISVLCTFENSFILQSIWNTSLAPPWQFRL